MSLREYGFVILSLLIGLGIGYLIWQPQHIKNTQVIPRDTVYKDGKKDTVWLSQDLDSLPAIHDTVFTSEGIQERAMVDTTVCNYLLLNDSTIVSDCDTIHIQYNFPPKNTFQVQLRSTPHILQTVPDSVFIRMDSIITVESGHFWESVRDISIGVAAGIFIMETVDATRK